MKKFFMSLFATCLFTCPMIGNSNFAKASTLVSRYMPTVSLLSKEDRIFFVALAHRESTNNPQKINKFGYIGKYQFGEEALVALGYYIKDSTKKNDWIGKWTGKYGIYSKEDFLSSSFIQDKAVRELALINWQTARNNKLHYHIGKKISGVTITKAGIIAGMHLKGGKSVIDFINYHQNSYDAFGTGVKDYMHSFSSYNVHSI